MPDSPEENNRKLMELAERTPASVKEVIEVLEGIATTAAQRERGEADGIACFSRLYHQITCDVLAAYDAGQLFHCGDFVYQLDLAFAQRYLNALRDHLDGGSEAPSCWALLFDRRQEEGIEEWQFAVVGVNAHVNFDLAFALLDVW
jgi:hypothetical protein